MKPTQKKKHVQKKKIMSDFGSHAKDTGSPEVQAAILTHRIKKVTEHLMIHKKDNHSRQGLFLMVGKRRRILNYVKRKDSGTYTGMLKKLGLRK